MTIPLIEVYNSIILLFVHLNCTWSFHFGVWNPLLDVVLLVCCWFFPVFIRKIRQKLDFPAAPARREMWPSTTSWTSSCFPSAKWPTKERSPRRSVEWWAKAELGARVCHGWWLEMSEHGIARFNMVKQWFKTGLCFFSFLKWGCIAHDSWWSLLFVFGVWAELGEDYWCLLFWLNSGIRTIPATVSIGQATVNMSCLRSSNKATSNV